MKTFFTLCVLTLFATQIKAQAVLNEIYCQPGNGYDEFFELYNPSVSPDPENLDNYTLVTYYEESGGKAGFYVLDFPNMTVDSQGFFVGASKLTFNIQSQLGLTADFNWNAVPSGGSLTKWESNGSTYTSVSVPANLNDLFVKITGAGGVFHIFLYKNGILVNGIIAGQNSTLMPPYITAMPDLFVDMSGSSPDFTINFSAIPNNAVEYISSSAGTNNGYYRSYDGLCGQWLKSDQPGQHNPKFTNGNYSGSSSEDIAIAAVISQYAGDPTKSVLTYNITSAPAGAFPLTIEVYLDSGIHGEFDVEDILFDTRTINNAGAGAQNIILPSTDISVIIVVRSSNDCFNKIMPIGSYSSILPVQLVSFQGSLNRDNKVTLNWTVADNRTANYFEIEKSVNGTDFKTIALVFASEKKDLEDYMYYETLKSDGRVMYRLKMYDNNKAFNYSKTIVLQNETVEGSRLNILGNPVTDKLTFSYISNESENIQVRIYDLSGKILMSEKYNTVEGDNTFSLSLSQSFNRGLYVIELNNNIKSFTAKFIKK